MARPLLSRVQLPAAAPFRSNAGTAVALKPVAWGQRDPALARGVCRNVLETTPATLIPFNPFTDARLRRFLRSMGIAHH